MPQYKKVFDVGTYAGVSGFTRVGIPTLRTPGAGGKQVAKSLRFRSANSAYLSRTFGTPTSQNTWTYSAWVKRGALSVQQTLFSAGTANRLEIILASNNTLQIADASTNFIITKVAYSDPSAWNHIVIRANGSGSAMQVYVNGVATTNSTTNNLTTSYWNASGVVHYIGVLGGYSSGYFDGYMSEVYFIDGTALDPTSFGEYNSDNIWVPKAYSGSYGTNGFYLDFNDTSSVAALGYDAAGSNDWAVNGISLTAGTTYDSMYDSPTDYDNSVYGAGNYAVLNPLDKSSTETVSFSDGNLKFAHTAYVASNSSGTRATLAASSGKYYTEYVCDKNSTQGNFVYGGWGDTTSSLSIANTPTSSVSFNWDNNDTVSNVVSGSYSSGAAAYGDVIGFAIDLDAGKYWVSRNGAWLNSGNPASGTGNIGTFTPNPTWAPFVSVNVGAPGYTQYQGLATLNFGQRPFSATPPTGFKALNTKNITRPTDANMWFYGDTPDLMWIKNRTATADHSLTDTVRGVGLGLTTNVTPAAENGAQDVAEMNKFGMTLIGASSRTTAASNSFVYWAWKGGGAAVTNTQGSITSQVSANISSGFSVVTYTGDGSASKTVGHGLNAIPSMVIMRKRNVTSDWYVAHYSLNNSYNFAWHMFLNTTGAVSSNNDPYFLSSGNTSSVIEVLNYSGSNGGNQSGTNYVAYCFAPIAGYSAFGSYTGNGSTTDGPFVYTGFRVKWLMVKRYDTGSTSNWQITHTGGSYYNGSGQGVYANLTQAEGTGVYHDLLSNGFKVKTNDGDANTLNGTYIYAAFAEVPFKIARAR